MVNPMQLMKMMEAKKKFDANHPKVGAFFQAAFAGGIEEGTVIEMSVKKPGQDAITTNIKVLQSDLELVEELKAMAQQK